MIQKLLKGIMVFILGIELIVLMVELANNLSTQSMAVIITVGALALTGMLLLGIWVAAGMITDQDIKKL